MKKMSDFCILLLMTACGTLMPNFSTVDGVRMTQRLHYYYYPSNKLNHDLTKFATAVNDSIPFLIQADNSFQLSEFFEKRLKDDQLALDQLQKQLDQDYPENTLANAIKKIAIIENRPKLATATDADLAIILKGSKAIGPDTAKYLIWYAPSIKDFQEEKHHNLVGTIAAPVVFAIAHHGLNKTAKALNEYDSVKNITQNIPEFASENGKMVVAATLAEGTRIAIEQGTEGISSNNVMKMAKKAGMQCGAHFIEEYGIIPITNSVLGKENSKTKTAVMYGLGLATVAGLNMATGSNCSMGFDFTVTI